MSTIDSLINLHEQRKGALHATIAGAERALKDSQKQLVDDLAEEFANNPDQDMDVGQMFDVFSDREKVADLVALVAASRPLKPSEMTDDLLSLVERSSYRDNSKDIPEILFQSLENDRDKVRFALFGSGVTQMYRLSESASEFLRTTIGIDWELSGKENAAWFTCIEPDVKTSSMKILLFRDRHDQLDQIAGSIVKLLDLGYQNRRIHTLRESCNRDGIVAVEISGNEGKDNWQFDVVKMAYGSRSIKHTGSGVTSEERLVDVLKHLAKYHWYEEMNEGNEV